MTRVLDTTLRDGANAVATGFTPDDIRFVVAGLAASGVQYIEVGNGISVASGRSHGRAPAVSDEHALRIAREAAPHAALGVIAVPAMASLEAAEALFEHLDFMRLAVAPHEMDACRPFVQQGVRRAKAMFVQLVKSHLYEPGSMVERVRPLVDDGAAGVYVVDTVGAMLPHEVAHRVGILHDAFDIPIGFHGHNNCAGALANSLAAIEAGAVFVDATLGGLGRGGGNLQLELLVARLQQSGRCQDIGLAGLFPLSQYLWSRFPHVARGIDPMEVWFALHGLDSTTRNEIDRTAADRGLDAFALIAQLARLSQGFFVTSREIAEAADRLGAAPAHQDR